MRHLILDEFLLCLEDVCLALATEPPRYALAEICNWRCKVIHYDLSQIRVCARVHRRATMRSCGCVPGVRTCSHGCVRRCHSVSTQTHKRAHAQINRRKHTRVRAHACIRACAHTCVCACACVRTCVRACMRACLGACVW